MGDKEFSMAKITMLHDIVEKNGKTIKENNLDKQHNLKIGDLVEITFKPYEGVRLFICKLSRDCDGTPLYCLTINLTEFKRQQSEGYSNFYYTSFYTGFSDSSIKLIK